VLSQSNSIRVAGALAVLAALVVDQSTKAIVVANTTALNSGVAIFPGFNLVFLQNDGVSFGFLGGMPWWSLVALALAICGWLAVLLFQANSSIEAVACGVIIGGAFGNVVDRVRYRAVTDFLDFYIGSAHWPAFNMADVFVVCGAIGLLFSPAMRTQHR